jgi:hypothetical protein
LGLYHLSHAPSPQILKTYLRVVLGHSKWDTRMKLFCLLTLAECTELNACSIEMPIFWLHFLIIPMIWEWLGSHTIIPTL